VQDSCTFFIRRLSLSTKRQKIGAELEKARAKRDEWERRVKALEASYEEAKKTEINDIVEAANITPEELAALIRKMKTEMPGSVTDDTEAEEENT
jgi:F0F1-type ATP synthase membrane subunit b/b'